MLSSVRNTEQTFSKQTSCSREAPLSRSGTHSRGSRLLSASAHWRPLTPGTVTWSREYGRSLETPPGFEAHVAQIALPLTGFPFSAFTQSPKGTLTAADLVPTATRSRKISFSGEKAELQRTGQEVRATGCSDPLTQLVGSRQSTGHLLQSGPEDSTSRFVTAVAGKLDGPTLAWVKMGLKKRAAIGYLYIWTEWPQKPPQPAWEGLKARQRLLNASGES